MTHLRTLLLTLLAVLALAGPSLAVGVTAAAADQLTMAAVEDADAPAFRPCERQGGKRVLPCHPDLGLLVRTATQRPWTTAPVPRPVGDLSLPERAPKTDPPPPRRG